MATNLQDRKTIALTQAHEVTYWSKKFGVPKSRLLAAVEATSNKVKDVEAWLTANPISASAKPATKKPAKC